MTESNTGNDQGNAGGISSAGGSESTASQNAGAASSRQTTRTTSTETTQADRSSVADGVTLATGEDGHDDPAEGVARADGGAQEREDARAEQRRHR